MCSAVVTFTDCAAAARIGPVRFCRPIRAARSRPVTRFRHPLVVRLVGLLVSAGLWGIAVRSTSASPTARYRAWLVEQAEAENAALVADALSRMQGETATPALFLSRYADAQLALAAPASLVRRTAAETPTSSPAPAPSAPSASAPSVRAPTGAWFGHPELSFLDALALLEGRLRTFDAPASAERFAAAQAAPVVACGVPLAPVPVAAFGPPEAVPTTAASVAPRRGVRAAILHGASAAQPQGP